MKVTYQERELIKRIYNTLNSKPGKITNTIEVYSPDYPSPEIEKDARLLRNLSYQFKWPSKSNFDGIRSIEIPITDIKMILALGDTQVYADPIELSGLHENTEDPGITGLPGIVNCSNNLSCARVFWVAVDTYHNTDEKNIYVYTDKPKLQQDNLSQRTYELNRGSSFDIDDFIETLGNSFVIPDAWFDQTEPFQFELTVEIKPIKES
jgi:hypothetical protein